MQLSKHFSLEEMTRSMVAARRGIDNSHEHPVTHNHTKSLVNEKQIELLQVQIDEIKESTANPLSN